MGLGTHREQILAALRGACRASLRDEEAAWRAIEKAVALAAGPIRARPDVPLDLCYAEPIEFEPSASTAPRLSAATQCRDVALF